MHPTTSTTWRFAVILTAVCAFLDSYTVLTRGAFASAQSGNVVLLATSLASLDWSRAAGHMWSVLAFAAGVAVALHVRMRWVDPGRGHPLRWMFAANAACLVALGWLPPTAPDVLIILPLAFMAGALFELFRRIGDLAYLPVATTGNLVRMVEALHGSVVEQKPQARRAVPVTVSIVAAFIGGGVAGAVATQVIGVRAIWLAAAGMAALLVLYIVDDLADGIRDEDPRQD